MKILYIGDNLDWKLRLRIIFQHEILNIAYGNDCDEEIIENYDIIFADYETDDFVDAFTIFENISKEKNGLFFILSEKASPNDYVKSIKYNVSDIILNNYSDEEIKLRVLNKYRIVIRDNYEDYLEYEDLKIDVEKRIVVRKNAKIDLEKMQFNLLVYLIKNKGEILSNNTISEEVWNKPFNKGDRHIVVTIARLKEKLNINIKNKKRVGYVLED